MTDEIPKAVYAFVDKLADSIGGTAWYRNLVARLAHENGLVPKEPEPDVPLLAMEAALTQYHQRAGPKDRPISAMLFAFAFNLAKHGHAIVKVATDEERLIEARELCAKVAVGIAQNRFAAEYREGDYDGEHEMIAMLAALKARDGVV